MRASSTVSANFTGSSANPGAKPSMITGMAIMHSSVSASSQNTITDSVSSAKPRALSCPSRASSPAKDGTKAALKAPSPNSRRNRLGSRLATKNASATGPAPTRAAIRMSRTKPRRRLAMVQPPTVRIPRSIART